ncbi:MAG TPA: hypothetical protein VFA66_00045 [Gaiellaceae bacterium]|nr:hypothetical protein [Gaiellaceae bacterium]
MLRSGDGGRVRRRWTGRRATRLSGALALGTLCACTSAAAATAARRAPAVTGLRITGTPARPVFVVSGTRLAVPRRHPGAPPAQRRLCHLATRGTVGYDYGDRFYVTVYARRGGRRLFGAGRYHPRGDELDCIGLVVLSHTRRRISFTFGSAYRQFSYPKLKAGRFVRLVLGDARRAVVVRYRSPHPKRPAAQ